MMKVSPGNNIKALSDAVSIARESQVPNEGLGAFSAFYSKSRVSYEKRLESMLRLKSAGAIYPK